MKVGLLSDTHGWLDPLVFDYFKDCDEIWHAGDIGNLQVMITLENFKKVRAVYGNIDDQSIQIRYPLHQNFVCAETTIWMTHIGGKPPRYTPAVLATLLKSPPHIFICGHSHILQIIRDPKQDNMWYLNPGAAGRHGFHQKRTLLRFELQQGRITHMEAIELGPRSELNYLTK